MRAITIGNLGKYDTPLLIIGGNCSIQGFDWKGQDIYWTVTGDNVRSISPQKEIHHGLQETPHYVLQLTIRPQYFQFELLSDIINEKTCGTKCKHLESSKQIIIRVASKISSLINFLKLNFYNDGKHFEYALCNTNF